MATPPEFAAVPVQADPLTGERILDGRAALPWAIDTLEVGGGIRDTVIRLQAWIRKTHGMGAPAD